MSGEAVPGGSTRIRILVVDDSAVARELLVHILSNDPALHVVGVAADGEEGVGAASRLQPDVIVMDIHLPKLDGYAATRAIMETHPTRIVMVSAMTDPKEVAANFRAIDAGALALLAKPVGPGHPGYAAACAELKQTVKLMSEVRVVRRWRRPGGPPAAGPGVVPETGRRRAAIVAIGASTGGPIALQALLSRLPGSFSVPILIVQHISESFVEGFAEWLARTTGYPVRVAAAGETVKPGQAYIAPSGHHMQVRGNGTIDLVDTPKEHGVRPAVSSLFRSVTAAYGPAAVGVLLTGMGRDGAEELKAMREAGAVTIAQDSESSVIFGMPGEAISLGAATYVLSPDKIAVVLEDIFGADCTPKP